MSDVAHVERIRWLRRRWFDETVGFTEAVHNFFDSVGFTQEYVSTLTSGSGRGKYSRKPKVIKDNTWGMIEVDWRSIRLLDCPIIQRLRSIKQLGFSYLTYPSAEHSRFIHSLGMFAVVWRFIEASLRTIDGEEPEPEGIRRYKLESREQIDLLHAAILHDVGHLPFSHATEAPLTANGNAFKCGPLSIEDFLFFVEEILQKELQLSEALSLAIILSPRFLQFYTEFVRPGDEDTDVTLRLAALVAGLSPASNLRGVAQVISNSSVDADKIDYINRDAVACGIPVGLDVARLFLRSNFYEVSAAKLERLGIQNPSGDEVIFVVNSSGVDTIDELAQSRAALYQRVYLHQTTRNAERLLSVSLESLPESNEPMRDALRLLSYDDVTLLEALSAHQTDSVKGASRRIRTRQLPTRSCVLGRSLATAIMPIHEIIPGTSPSEISKQTLGMAVDKLRSVALRGDAVRTLEAAILGEAENLATLIRAKDPSLAPDAQRPSIVTVLPMRELAGLTKEAIVLENHELTYSSNRSISDEQNEAADLYKALGYVLTDREWREIVCLAARKIIAQKFEEPVRKLDLTKRSSKETTQISLKCAARLVLDQRAITRRASLKADRVESLQSLAGTLGYFDDLPWLLPTDEREFIDLANKLKKFDGQGSWTVTTASCAAFVSQFPPALRQETKELLVRELRIVDREMIRSCLEKLIDAQADKFKTLHVTGLTPDSGNTVRMLLEHEAKAQFSRRGIYIHKDLPGALKDIADGDLLLLCDDVLNSGSQVQCQFRSWFGIPRDQWPMPHQTELGVTEAKLDEQCLEKLRKANVAIAICEGSNAGIPEVTRVIKDLGIVNFVDIFIANALQRTSALSPELKDFLSRVGADLIAYKEFSGKRASQLQPSESRACVDNALGYGNAGGLLTTYVNVPTSTLTCLWCPGIARGHPWMPLLLRRGYIDQLIIA